MLNKYNWTATILLATLAAPATACATEPPPRPVALDPSNPAAPESPRLVLASDSRPAPPPSAAASDPREVPSSTVPAKERAHEHGVAGAPAEKHESADKGKAGKQEAAPVYTCPMHPEVISDKPGNCPKCGMKLVLKKPAAPEGKK